MTQKVYKLINAQQSGGSGGSVTGEKVKVSETDTTSGYLQQKIQGSNTINVTRLNPGNDESLRINVNTSNINHNDLINSGNKTHIELEEDIDELFERTTKYSQQFNDNSDWTLNGDYYELSVLATTHEKGQHIFVVVMDTAGSWIDTAINIDNSGNVTIGVLSSPDLRFEGKLVIY